jgi:hypothetical protein
MGRKGKSCAAVCGNINESFGSQVKHQTVRDYVQKWLIDVSPKKRGQVGFIPHGHFNVMDAAAEIFIMINQLGQDGAPN